MNHLRPTGEGTWQLPTHARLVVYERDRGEREQERAHGLLTIYGCSATQNSPKARLLGTLESVDANAEIESNPTGRVVTLRGEATLERTGERRYRIA